MSRLTDDEIRDRIQLDVSPERRLVFRELLELRAELELRRKVMVDIPCRCGHCGCDWDYTPAVTANPKATPES